MSLHLEPTAADPGREPPGPLPEEGAEVEVEPVAVGPAGSGWFLAQPVGWSDPLTGVDGPRFWDRTLLSEAARVRRYKRPATVAFAELVGLATLSRLWGADVAERALVGCARTLAGEIRSSDHIARVEAGTFGILLTETGEVAAINFVERARAACEAAIGTVGLETVRIGFGWASPPTNGDLVAAAELARERLAAELAAG